MASVNVHPSMAPQQAAAGVKDVPLIGSKFLEHVRYDPASFQLTVTMKKGAQYIYFYVYPMVVDQWLDSPSVDRFYSEGIKGKHLGVKTIHQGVGKPVRNPMKGPTNEHQRVS